MGWVIYNSKGVPLITSKAHDHTTADGSGPLTNDEHDGYSQYNEIAAPAAPAADKLRLYAKDVGGVTALCFVDSAGVEKTFLARTRSASMSILSSPSTVIGGAVIFDDGVIRDIRATVHVPTDWVAGTAITINAYVHKAGAAAGNACLASYISVYTEGEAESWNVENAALASVTIGPGANVLKKVTRTIAGAKLAADDDISWVLRRLGADATDTLDESMLMNHGPWIEYTAFF